jgi:hypothetical protein
MKLTDEQIDRESRRYKRLHRKGLLPEHQIKALESVPGFGLWCTSQSSAP